MVNEDNFSQMKIRIPVDMKDWLENQAKRNIRSQSAEIVFILRKEMEKSLGASASEEGDGAGQSQN